MTKRLTAEFPDKASSQALNRTRDFVHKIGGRVLDFAEVNPTTELIYPETETAPPPISKIEFDRFALIQFNRTRATQAWRTGMTICITACRKKEMPKFAEILQTNEFIDLELILTVVREIEAGEWHHTHGLGAKFWSFYAKLINRRLVGLEEPPLVIEWDPEIHPDLDKTNYKKDDAVARLRAKYDQIRTAHSDGLLTKVKI